MPYHCSVESVFRHLGAVAPTLFGLAPFGTTILVPHLYAILGKSRFHREQFPCTDIWIMGLLEGFLQLLQLTAGEDGASMSSLVLLLATGTSTAGSNQYICPMGTQQSVWVIGAASGGA